MRCCFPQRLINSVLLSGFVCGTQNEISVVPTASWPNQYFCQFVLRLGKVFPQSFAFGNSFWLSASPRIQFFLSGSKSSGISGWHQRTRRSGAFAARLSSDLKYKILCFSKCRATYSSLTADYSRFHYEVRKCETKTKQTNKRASRTRSSSLVANDFSPTSRKTQNRNEFLNSWIDITPLSLSTTDYLQPPQPPPPPLIPWPGDTRRAHAPVPQTDIMQRDAHLHICWGRERMIYLLTPN